MPQNYSSIFAEQIQQGRKRRVYKAEDETGDNSYPRIVIIGLVALFALGLLFTRLFFLTVVEGDKYYQLSAGNRVRETKINAPRGIIYDRNGKALVRNIPTFTSFGGQVFYETMPATVAAYVKESITRQYIYKDATAHIMGYVGQADKAEIKSGNLSLGDIVGKIGIEQKYNSLLAGINGRQLTEVDALGSEVRTLGNVDPVPGKNLTLSLDVLLQQIAREELAKKKGAVVAADPKTGQILAMYSSPSFDPNKLIRNEDIESLFADADQPFFDRAISGLYPPGSTFKIVTAIAALESGAINKDTKIEDTGILQVGAFSFGNWYFLQYGRKEGLVDIKTAIKRSNDIFFYKAGEATGIETIASWAKKIGLGKTLGIDIAGEEEGVMPDPAWRQKVRSAGWYLGDTYHVAIGQGDLQVTPLQVNAWTNVIANGGRLCRPHLVKTNSGKDAEKSCKDLGIKKETIDLIREGIKEACSPGGTGWPLFQFKVKSEKLKVDGIDFFETYESTTSANKMVGIPVACKTGTAEFNDPKNRTHAWFTVFAPVVNPQISVTVLVEGGGEGSNVAAPIAKKILEKWFSQ